MANTTHTDRDLLSTAKLCEVLQSSPLKVERAAEAAHVEPVLRLNGVSYWADSTVDTIREALKSRG
jgi:hypothetical protein